MLTDVVIANKSYTRLNLSGKERIDEIALRVIKQDCPDFLLPVRTMEIDGEQIIRYELSEGIRLSYSSLKLSKKEFSAMLENMLLPFKICNDWFLDYHNILLDTNYIFLGKKDYTIKYIYVPAGDYALADEDIIDFFSSFILKAEILDDSHYAVDLLRVLRSEDANLMTLLDFIFRESEKTVGRSDRSNAGPVRCNGGPDKEIGKDAASAAGPGKPSGEFDRQDVQGNLVGSLFGEDDEEAGDSKAGKSGKKPGKERETRAERDKGRKDQAAREKPARGGFFDKLKGKTKKEEEQGAIKRAFEPKANGPAQKSAQFAQSRQDMVLPAAEPEEDTTEISEEKIRSDGSTLRLMLIESGGYHCPGMVEIDLSRGFATVGRLDKNGQAQSDYCFDAVLSFISRRHFRVESADGQYAIVDLGSGNGTFVNGEALTPNIKHPLRAGDMIMISQRHRLIYQVC